MAFWISGVLLSVMLGTVTAEDGGAPALYFPVAQVALVVPELLSPGTELFRTRALPLPPLAALADHPHDTGADAEAPVAPSIPVEYGLRAGAPPWLRMAFVDEGDLLLSVGDSAPLHPGVSNATVEAKLNRHGREDLGPNVGLAFLSLELIVLGDKETRSLCSSENSSAALCFWPAVRLQVLEESPSVDLGAPGPLYLQRFCGQTFHYKLKTGASGSEGLALAEVRPGEWHLRTSKPLDREAQATLPTTALLCSAKNAPTNAQWAAEITMAIIDRNDNPPGSHSAHATVYLDTDRLVKGSKYALSELLMQDPDSSLFQRYNGHVAEDPLGIWRVQCDNPMELTYSWKFPHSVTYCYLTPSQNMSLAVQSVHNVTIIVNDTTMESSNPGQKSHVEVRLSLVAGPKPPRNVVSAALTSSVGMGFFGGGGGGGGSGGGGGRPRFPRAVALSRWAAALARVARPRLRAALTSSTSLAFRMQVSAPEANGALAITPTQGIIYVQHPEALLLAPENFTVHVQWTRGDDSAASWEMRVRLLGDPSASEGHPCALRSGGRFPHCADFASQRQCTSQCGIGVGAARELPRKGEAEKILDSKSAVGTWNGACTWRSSGPSQPHAHANYSTCTPDTATCPDGECDELEHHNPYLCPQDCEWSKEDNLPVVYNAHGRGIALAPGVCSCSTPDNCVCLHNPPVLRASSTTTTTTSASAVHSKYNASAAPTATDIADAITTDGTQDPPGAVLLGGASEQCGVGCLLAAVVGSILLLGGAAALAVWRYRTSGKGRCAQKLASSGGGGDGARDVTRPFPPGIGPAPAPAASDPLRLPGGHDTTFEADPRWEFPRQQLVLEQPLGEGEFGQVLRARALNIAGRTGWTTVAVKTLKEGAAAAELADLLSEFSLLRGVSHPNVVRLLGACSAGCAAGEPFLLLMEFAEHGSLRAYLRRSRHAESDGALPCTAPDGPPLPPAPAARAAVVTPRDVLAFAWQICKGMAYLSDMKLVHRDLAARNVLVADGGICKISDFGLTRDVYEDDTYMKRSKGRVPVKWMSLESLADHIYTSKSDVWSFGVLLWELVTLGASPYPGVAVHNLFHLLKAGYRMQRPENCSLALYQIMRSCWLENPDERPIFKELTSILEKMLQDGVDYLDLNPRTVHNMTYFTSLSSPRNLFENVNLNYGNLTLLPVESLNYPALQKSPKDLNTMLSKCKDEAEEEERLIQTPVEITSVDITGLEKIAISDNLDKGDVLRQGNAYLSPVHRTTSLPRDSPVTGSTNHVAPTQRYISMSVGDQKQKSCFLPESSPESPNSCLKVTTF